VWFGLFVGGGGFILVAVALLAVYVFGVHIMLTIGLARAMIADDVSVEHVEYRAWRWPLVLLGVVR